MKKILLYGHGGCYNHGNEALTLSTVKYLRNIFPKCEITVSTHFAKQDKEFNLPADNFIERNTEGKTNEEVYAETLKAVTPNTLCVFIGGDNLCYSNWQRYTQVNDLAYIKNAKSILWSCSVDSKSISTEMLKTLNKFSLITARECITYDALIMHGLKNVIKVADIAFSLEAEYTEFSSFSSENFVVINASPLICRKNNIALTAYKKLIEHILATTDLNIALVPHVMAKTDNDCEALKELYTDNKRIKLISNSLRAAQYKYIVSKARFCITARTHLAIAAYSSCVPTLAVGYSVKALGIAKDLQQENFVTDVMSIKTDTHLISEFTRLTAQEEAIRNQLKANINSYKNSATKTEIAQFLEETR